MGTNNQPSVLGISFDGLPISGIVNEFLSVAFALHRRGYRVLLDVGYDITLRDPNSLASPNLPCWVTSLRTAGLRLPSGYSSEALDEARALVTSGTSILSAGTFRSMANDLSQLILSTLEREGVRLLVVENGTLPDNPIFTEAIYQAIQTYGQDHELDRFVLWRDHDLMWSAEPHLYGSYPYPGVRRPRPSPFIHFAVSTRWMKSRMESWAPGPEYVIIPNRFFSPVAGVEHSRKLRAAYDIPEEAYLIARCTRVIPQKTIDWDMYLIATLQRRLRDEGHRRPIYLFVTGPTQEEPDEFERLCSVAEAVDVGSQIIWGNGILPLNPLLASDIAPPPFSIRHLLAEANLSSFLTSYDYEGFGNPPGEAMAMNVPFVSTTYELYHEVYGNKGAVAPLLQIKRGSSARDRLPDSFVAWTIRLLKDRDYRAQVVRRNRRICNEHFSLEALTKQVDVLFPPKGRASDAKS